MFNSEDYIKKLVKESVEEAFGKRNNADIDDFDVNDEYTKDDQQDSETDVNQGQKNNRGKGFQGGRKYMQNKTQHDAALNRMRSNLPYDDGAFSAPWTDSSDEAKNPHNKSTLDPLAADSFGRIKVKAAQVPNPKSEKYKEPLVVIDMLNIDPQDCVEIAKNLLELDIRQT
jgi:hypothetical protein